MSNVKIRYSSIPILLTTLLCILKLTGILDISWLWCFSLMWMPFAIIIGIMSIIFALALPFLIIKIIHDLITK